LTFLIAIFGKTTKKKEPALGRQGREKEKDRKSDRQYPVPELKAGTLGNPVKKRAGPGEGLQDRRKKSFYREDVEAAQRGKWVERNRGVRIRAQRGRKRTFYGYCEQRF